MMNNRIKKHSATVYKTDHFTQNQIAHLKESATRQEKVIARLFWNNGQLSPGQVYEMIGGKWPITSVRRAITNLTKDDVLVKTEQTRIGDYGRPETIWRWKRAEDTNKQSNLFEN